MAETEAIIRISAPGSEAASAALSSVTKSMDGIAGGSDKIKSKFQERFQHIGLALFAGDALHAAGVGKETRAVISTLNLALNEGSIVAGISSGGFMLIVTALAALGGVIAKVIEHHKSLNAELEKINETNHKQLLATNDVIKTIQDYEKETGNVPAYLARWEASEKSLMKAQVERQIQGDKAQIASLTLLMNQEQRHGEKLKEQIVDQTKLIASLKAMGTDQALIIQQTAQLNILTKEYGAGAMAAEEHKAEIDKLIVSVKLLGSEGTDDLKKLTDAHKEATKESEKEADEETARFQHWGELHAKKLEAMEKETLQDAEEETKRYQSWAALNAKKDAESTKVNDHIYAVSKSAINAIEKEQANAFAQMIVHGQSFSQATAHLWSNIAVQVIAAIEEMVVKLLILYAIEMATGLGPAAIGVSSIGKAFGFATGGEMLVDRPTMFIAGDSGPELATFTPLSQMNKSGGGGSGSGGGGGGGVQIGSINTTVNGVQDVDQIASQVGMKIAQRIRGQGEINFTRST